MPFAGCPNKCSFCDQHKITGQISSVTPDDVRNAVETALCSGGIDPTNSEIAFFGGSFTAIERSYMRSLLSAASEYSSVFKGIRISTRPDCIDDEILSELKSFGVTSIELGAQSMLDEVLLCNNRGHNSRSVSKASELIKSYGFSLGLQMMTGLFGSNYEADVFTAREFVRLSPDTVRIYPTVVLKGTYLAELYEKNIYDPPTVDESVVLCAELIELFESNNLSVIRVGLHSSETIESNIVAGAYHPAFRELCENRIFLNKVLNFLNDKQISGCSLSISVSPASVSKLIGQKKTNIIKLNEMGYDVKIIPDKNLSERQIIIQEG